VNARQRRQIGAGRAGIGSVIAGCRPSTAVRRQTLPLIIMETFRPLIREDTQQTADSGRAPSEYKFHDDVTDTFPRTRQIRDARASPWGRHRTRHRVLVSGPAPRSECNCTHPVRRHARRRGETWFSTCSIPVSAQPETEGSAARGRPSPRLRVPASTADTSPATCASFAEGSGSSRELRKS